MNIWFVEIENTECKFHEEKDGAGCCNHPENKCNDDNDNCYHEFCPINRDGF